MWLYNSVVYIFFYHDAKYYKYVWHRLYRLNVINYYTQNRGCFTTTIHHFYIVYSVYNKAGLMLVWLTCILLIYITSNKFNLIDKLNIYFAIQIIYFITVNIVLDRYIIMFYQLLYSNMVYLWLLGAVYTRSGQTL